MFILLRSWSEITFGINILSRYRKSFLHIRMKTALQNAEFTNIRILQNGSLEIWSEETRRKKMKAESNEKRGNRK